MAATGAVGIDFGTFGLGLPHTVGWSVPHAGIGGIVVAILIAVGTYRYLGAVRGPALGEGRWSHSAWWRLGVAGILVFALGYSIFLTTGRIGFSSTGIANRVSTAAALGASIVLIAVLGWATTWLRSPGASDRAFRAGIAALCASGVIVINGLGSFWIQSWQTQRDVLAEVHAALPTLPSGSTVLLEGVCPYVGPAIVFESSWDLQGALRVHHRDRSLGGDVTGGITSIEPRGIVTRIYQVEVVHPYREHLYLYDRATGTAVALTDEDVARRLLSAPRAPSCPDGRPGSGTVELPFDSVVYWIQIRLGA